MDKIKLGIYGSNHDTCERKITFKNGKYYMSRKKLNCEYEKEFEVLPKHIKQSLHFSNIYLIEETKPEEEKKKSIEKYIEAKEKKDVKKTQSKAKKKFNIYQQTLKF